MEIKNENLCLFLETKFNKRIGEITQEDCNQCDLIPFSGNYKSPQDLSIDFSILEKFPNASKVTVSNAYITVKDMETVGYYSNICSISFNKCMFDNLSLNSLKNLEQLSLIGCFNEEYSFISDMSQLRELEISNPYTEEAIDMNLLNGNNSINKLILNRCILENFSAIKGKQSLKYLSLLWTQLSKDYFEVLNSLSNLEKLYIKEDYNNALFSNSDMIVRTNLLEDTFLQDDDVSENEVDSIGVVEPISFGRKAN